MQEHICRNAVSPKFQYYIRCVMFVVCKHPYYPTNNGRRKWNGGILFFVRQGSAFCVKHMLTMLILILQLQKDGLPIMQLSLKIHFQWDYGFQRSYRLELNRNSNIKIEKKAQLYIKKNKAIGTYSELFEYSFHHSLLLSKTPSKTLSLCQEGIKNAFHFYFKK